MRTLIAIALCVSACAGGPAPGRCAGSPDAGAAPGMVVVWNDASGQHELRATRLTCVDATGTEFIPRFECSDGTVRLEIKINSGFAEATATSAATWTDLYGLSATGVSSLGGRSAVGTPNVFVIRATESRAPGISRVLRATGSFCSWNAEREPRTPPGTATFNGLELVMPPGV